MRCSINLLSCQHTESLRRSGGNVRWCRRGGGGQQGRWRKQI